MSESEFVRSLLVYGVAAVKGNDKQEARSHLNRVLYQTDASLDQKVEAWWWLSQITESPEEKRELLQNILQIDPTEPRARREMAVLKGKLEPQEVLGPHEAGHPLSTSAPFAVSNAYHLVCPQCGGTVSYLVSQQALCCASCGTILKDSPPCEAFSSIEEQDFYADLPTTRGRCWELPSERNSKCQGCGALFLVPASNMTGSCPYCESPYAVEPFNSSSLIRPQGVVTFRIDAESALDRARTYLSRHFSFLEPEHTVLNSPTGIYIPFWTFDIQGELHWRRRLPKEVQQGWSIALPSQESSVQEEETGNWPVNYDDLLIPASSKLPAELLYHIADFDTGDAVPYTIDLLAGWATEIYQVTMADASVKAHQLAFEKAKREFLETFSPFDSVAKPTFSSSGISIDTYKLLLLPVWKIAPGFHAKRTVVLVNGQTGTVAESEPAV
jgi:hypothetical protein